MNTKSLIEAYKNNESFSSIAERLIDDAEGLITVRRAQTDAAKRSCYLEQDSKYRSMVRQLDLPDADKFLNYMKDSKRIKRGILEEKKAPAEVGANRFRFQVLQMYAEQVERFSNMIKDYFEQGLKIAKDLGDIEERKVSIVCSRMAVHSLADSLFKFMLTEHGVKGIEPTIKIIGESLVLIEDPRFDKSAVGRDFLLEMLKIQHASMYDAFQKESKS